MTNTKDLNSTSPAPPTVPKKRGGARPGAGRKPKYGADFQKAQKATRQQLALAAVAALDGAVGNDLQAIPDALTILEAIEAIERQLAPALPGLLPMLFELAHGTTVVREEFEAAGLVLVDAYETDENGKSYKVKRPAFPAAKPGEMVLVRRIEQDMPPDRATLEYLFNRILGKPAERKEMRTKDEETQDPQGTMSRQDMLAEMGEMLLGFLVQRRGTTLVSEEEQDRNTEHPALEGTSSI